MRPHVNSKVIKRKPIHAQSALPVKMQVVTDLRVLPKESSLFNTFLLNLHTHQDAGRWISVSFPFVLLGIREISTLYNQPETSVGMFWEKNVKWLILPVFSNQFQLYERGFIHTHRTSVSARPHGTPHGLRGYKRFPAKEWECCQPWGGNPSTETGSKTSVLVTDSSLRLQQQIVLPRPELSVPTASLSLTHSSLNGFHKAMYKILLQWVYKHMVWTLQALLVLQM